jgi:hypothetical protein
VRRPLPGQKNVVVINEKKVARGAQR